uniref:Uncharacterized protein n=1 Tax=Arundo donax TaxID=35708 RepID=A0A0A9E995_ARUDO
MVSALSFFQQPSLLTVNKNYIDH